MVLVWKTTPSASPAELSQYLDEYIEYANAEYDGIFNKGIDVYSGVDRSIFKGAYAMTDAAERQQALTGDTWDIRSAAEDSKGVLIAACAIGGLGAIPGAFVLGFTLSWAISSACGAMGMLTGVGILQHVGIVWNSIIMYEWSTVTYVLFLPIAAGLLFIAGGMAGISLWYNYYNPDYTEIPDTMIDIREGDLGDKYIKYTAAKVFEDGELSEKNADFNAYEGREWNALYYTKDATAGNCLTPNFVFSDSTSAVTRRYQGVSMFGETNAFNLNSHVYNADAKGAYLTVRYSSTKKAAANVPTVVGSVFSEGTLYVVTALGGAVVGMGGTLLLQRIAKAGKKKKAGEAEPQAAN